MIENNPDGPIRIGLIGIGGYGQRHLMTMRSLGSSGLCELVAIADPFASRLPDTVAALLAEGVDIYDDYHELLARDDIHAIIIATPIALHYPQALDALKAGKHVYVEKPPCVSLEEYEALENAREAAGKECAVGFQMQSTPAMRFIKSQLLAGVIGDLETVWASIGWRRGDRYYSRSSWAGKWELDGAPVYDGPATNALSHVVNASLFLAGETQNAWGEVERVRGSLRKARDMESYDCCYMEADTAAGVNVRLALAHATSRHDEAVLRCAGSRGQATISWDGTVLVSLDGEREREYEFRCESHFLSILNFLQAIRNPEIHPNCGYRECLPYGQFVNGALQSSGGACAFDSALVSRDADSEGDCFLVAGLDEQMVAFASDPEAAPLLLSAEKNPWLTPAVLSPTLPVPALA